MNGKILKGTLLVVAALALVGAKPQPTMRLDVTGSPEDMYVRLDESASFVTKEVNLKPMYGLVLQKTEPAGATVVQEKPIPDDEGALLSFSFEKVESSTGASFRCLCTYKAPQLLAEIDELSEVERHVKKTVELGDDARKRLSEILSTAKLRGFDPEYTGTPSEPGSLQRFRLHVVRSTRAFDVTIENGVAPQAFQDVCSQLDAFAKSELRIWAIQSTVKELLEKSAVARRVADERWAERGETNYEKFDEALKKYKESLHYLETVNPKPADYKETCERCEMVKQEIERVYKQLHSNYAKYYHLEQWEQARKELQDILTLVPDSNDERYREAQSQLLELESRIKSRR